MKVFKFGGASLGNPERIRRMADIVASVQSGKLVVVVSAMGKTTNALEEVASAFFDGKKEEALSRFEEIKSIHLSTLQTLSSKRFEEGKSALTDIFTEIEWLLHDKPVRGYDYYYDQIVCCGELMSSTIVSHYLQEKGIENSWLDARDIIRTDDNFREGKVDWEFSGKRMGEIALPLLNNLDILVTQGFIGSTDDNESTTLGREGSDYTAAILANLLDAESLTIWKDVASVMSADPRLFPEALPLQNLSYTEVIEMAFYGAQVIHPKTIKPLQNKNIPLCVKCFLDPSLPGTLISEKNQNNLPPIIVIKEIQALVEFRSKDFSFVEDEPIEKLHRIFNKVRLKPNITQNAAISLLCCFDDRPEKIEQIALDASDLFDVVVHKGLSLLTVRHYDEKTIHALIEGKKIMLEQRTPSTAQLVTIPVS